MKKRREPGSRIPSVLAISGPHSETRNIQRRSVEMVRGMKARILFYLNPKVPVGTRKRDEGLE
jgi:hypothetical protein